MNRNSVILLVAFLLAAPPGARAEKPNILILAADDHASYTLGLDGDPHGATPNLDRLGRQGVYFDRAFCNAPVCTASRQSFLTGRYPHAVGVTVLSTPLPEQAITLADWLSERGYLTGAIGKMHFNGPSRHGFDIRIDTPDWHRWLAANPPEGGDQRRPWRPFRDPAAVWLNSEARDIGLPLASCEASFFVEKAQEFLNERRDDGRPFALVVSFREPHSPFDFPREWAGRFDAANFPVRPISEFDRTQQPEIFAPLTPTQVQGIQAAYYTSLHYVDSQIGRVLEALNDSGLAENTIVVYWGDHGYALGHRGRFEKHTLYEESVRAPLIVRWPGRIEPDRKISDLVEFVDVFPTLMDLLDLPHPPDLHGRTLAPVLLGQAEEVGREAVFCEYLENEEAMLRTDRYKLIVGTGRRARTDGYQTGRPLPGPYVRLYDLETDPDETIDLADLPEQADRVGDMIARLRERLTSTREGVEAPPEGLLDVETIHWCLVPRDAPDVRASEETPPPTATARPSRH